MKDSNNHPFNEVIMEADKVLEEGGDRVNIYQKFTCAKCGQRLTVEEPNRFYISGTCDQCGATTDIQKDGCNYMIVARAV